MLDGDFNKLKYLIATLYFIVFYYGNKIIIKPS